MLGPGESFLLVLMTLAGSNVNWKNVSIHRLTFLPISAVDRRIPRSCWIRMGGLEGCHSTAKAISNGHPQGKWWYFVIAKLRLLVGEIYFTCSFSMFCSP